jgi:phenylacetate-CoA ligase
MAELALEVELAPKCDGVSTVAARIAESLQTSLHLRMPVQAVPAGTLPRFEMKARRWVKNAG